MMKTIFGVALGVIVAIGVLATVLMLYEFVCFALLIMRDTIRDAKKRKTER